MLNYQRCFQNSVKHLRWSFSQKLCPQCSFDWHDTHDSLILWGFLVALFFPRFIFRLVPISVGMQIEQLIKSKEYEMALTITELLNNEDSSKKKKILQIKSLYAFDLFCKKKFEEAIKLFREVDKEPTYVIGLFPDLLPREYRKQLDYPSEPPHLTQGDLEKGIQPKSIILWLISIPSTFHLKKSLGSKFYLQFMLHCLPKMFTRSFIRGLDDIFWGILVVFLIEEMLLEGPGTNELTL